MKVRFVKDEIPASGTVVAIVSPDGGMSDAAREVNDKSGGLVKRALESSGKEAKVGSLISLFLPANLDYTHLVLMVMGTETTPTALNLEELGGQLAMKLKSLNVNEVAIGASKGLEVNQDPDFVAAKLAAGALLRSYRFDKYRTSNDDEGKAEQTELVFMVSNPEHDEFARVRAQTDAVFKSRDIVSEPANVIYPLTFAEACAELRKLDVEVGIYDKHELEELGMRALLAVNQGSAKEPRVVTMRWHGDGDAKPVAFVGKGVCFDSGGLSLKPAASMQDMKTDMGGAGAVYGAMYALAARKARANIIGVLGLVENMPSGTAQRPGDVVTAMSGKTIEVLNTDAEGRLVLADLLWYTQDRFKPQVMIDLATLTGAVISALGSEHAGLFANDDALAGKIQEAGEQVGEKVWRLPLGADYDKHIKSEIADIKNVGRGRSAGAIAGAVFLQQFVNNVPWAHLDIAGTASSSRDSPLAPKGATGFGVRLLDELIARSYES